MKTNADPLTLLKNHSGIISPENEEFLSLADWLWQKKSGHTVCSVDVLWADLGDCFEGLNRELNSRSNSGGQNVAIPRECAYAVSGIISLCHVALAESLGTDDGFVLNTNMLKLTWKLSTAWDALIAGDIEDIRQHVALEARARGLE